MAEYRTLKMNFWNDPFIEDLPSSTKLLYLYLISSPHTNNLGVLEVTRRRIAYETGLDPQDVENGLAQLETAGKVFSDENIIWLCNFVKNQTTTSPKLVDSLKKLITNLSERLRQRVWEQYPFLFDGATSSNTLSQDSADGKDTLSIPSGELEVELELGSGSGTWKVEEEVKNNTLVGDQAADACADEGKLKPPRVQIPYSEVMQFWNTICGPRGKPRITELSETRKRKIRSLWRERPTADFRELETWAAFLNWCTKSELLMDGAWFTFDWLLKPENFLKITEGNYHLAPGGRKKAWGSQ